MPTIKRILSFPKRHPGLIISLSYIAGIGFITSSTTHPNYFIWGMLLFILVPFYYLISWFRRDKKSESKAEKAARLLAQRQEADKYVEDFKNNKRVPPVTVDFFLRPKEYAFLGEAQSVLREPRAVRQYSGGRIGFRVARGIWVGNSAGQSRSTQQWQTLDQGKLTLTNQRIVFDGSKERRTIEIENMDQVKGWLDAIEIIATNKTKSMLFTVKNPYLWHLLITLIKTRKSNIEAAISKPVV